MSKVGERVGAILSADEAGVRFLGYGKFEGEFVPPKEIGGLGVFLNELNLPNTKIALDNGKVVWGCECWWAPEEEMKQKIAGAVLKGTPIINTDIDVARLES